MKLMHKTLKLKRKEYPKQSYADQGEDLILARIITRILHLDIHQSRTYVDIGSNHPINHSITYSLYRLGWCGLTIDGSDYAKLFAKYRPKDIFINKVVGEEDNIEVAFYTHCGGINLINQKDTPTNPQSYTKGSIKQININK